MRLTSASKLVKQTNKQKSMLFPNTWNPEACAFELT